MAVDDPLLAVAHRAWWRSGWGRPRRRARSWRRRCAACPSSSGSSQRVALLLAPGLPRCPTASSSALPESGALLPKTTGAEEAAPEDLVQQAQPDLAEAHPAELGRAGGRPTGPGPSPRPAAGRSPRASVGVVERQGLEGEDLLVHERRAPRPACASYSGSVSKSHATCRLLSSAPVGRPAATVCRCPATPLPPPRVAPSPSRAPVEPLPGAAPPRRARSVGGPGRSSPPPPSALLDERRLLDAEELAGLAVVPDESVTALAVAGPRGPAGLVRARGRGGGDPVGQDRGVPRGLPLLLPVVALRHAR